MDSIRQSELPAALSIPIGSHNGFSRHALGVIIVIQLVLCIISSVGMSYFFYTTVCTAGKKSWKSARDVMKPIEKRLRNLEKEKVIWNLYLEWMEDYCAVYYGLLNYLNTTVTDLDKLYRDHSLTLKSISEDSDQTIHSELCSTKTLDSQYGGLTSEPSWEGLTSDEDVQLVANFARVFANLKAQGGEKIGTGDLKRETDCSSTMSLDVGSTIGTNEESVRDELESLIQTSDDEAKLPRKDNTNLGRRTVSEGKHQANNQLPESTSEVPISSNT